MPDKSPRHEMIRAALRAQSLKDEGHVFEDLVEGAALSLETRQAIGERAQKLVRFIREESPPSMMELFLGEYGLSTDEGAALMCLAEALLRVPDVETIDALIEDKIASSKWADHLGRSSSPLVNASTWGLMFTGAVLRDDAEHSMVATLRSAIKRLGEPVIRQAITQSMRELGRQFILGQTIKDAIKNTKKGAAKGYTYSFDMLGEAARTKADARGYHLAYSESIAALAKLCSSGSVRENPGISVKLSALHPRYEETQKSAMMEVMVPTVTSLALLAKSAGIGFNIDAEEAHRLDLSLDIIEAVLGDPALKGWGGFGVVVQSYDKRAALVIDWLYDLATRLDRKIMVRLVKGAYWDTEIKYAQVLGLTTYPVFTQKASTDVSYIACARKLFEFSDRIYPQFATHNAHTTAAVLELAKAGGDFEFQRLHGMGAALHDALISREGARSRIYAPVGSHKDLLAYLVRRLLENGANSSFVSQIVDKAIPVEAVAADPFCVVESYNGVTSNPNIVPPPALYAPRRNSAGWEIMEAYDLQRMDAARAPFANTPWHSTPLLLQSFKGSTSRSIINPANPDDIVGEVIEANPEDIGIALSNAERWQAPPKERAAVLNRASDFFEADSGELFALLTREAGKNPLDAIAELREAVDFLRYYAAELMTHSDGSARGIFACISPWNFPLAIFTGQIAAALAAGNGVIAKPAEQTPLIAFRAVQLLHEAGVPKTALQFCPGDGPSVGARLVSDPGIHGVCFTGSTNTAQRINRAMSKNMNSSAPLIAETGGLNAMLVDSTALMEQAVRDIIASAFQSAGQRCSALRILYLQEDVAEDLLTMLYGAMEILNIGDPWEFSTDVGPVIDEEAKTHIQAYINQAKDQGRLLKILETPDTGRFVAPCVIAVDGIETMGEEIFGPVLHVARFAAGQVDEVIDSINDAGYGLTFGLHTRIDDRVQHIIDRVHVGNIYVNRNQIGAIVGSQPFGGEGLSGTGPKAGGPHYLPRFFQSDCPSITQLAGECILLPEVQEALNELAPVSDEMMAIMNMEGPTGESNRLGLFPRGRILCLGPGAKEAQVQAEIVEASQCLALQIAPGTSSKASASSNDNTSSNASTLSNKSLDGYINPATLAELEGFDAVIYWGSETIASALRQALASRPGRILPLIREQDFSDRLHLERHVCVDTTATGGNATLLGQSAEQG